VGGMAIQSLVPLHDRSYAWRVKRWLADLQGMIAHELLSDPTAQCRDEIRLDKNRRSGEKGGAQRDSARKPTLGEPAVDKVAILTGRGDSKMGQGGAGRRREVPPARPMAASHHHGKPILEQRLNHEAFAWNGHAAET